MKLTYAESGVDVDRDARAISALISSLEGDRPRSKLVAGHFAGLVEVEGMIIALCTDGVGTKLVLAQQFNKLDTVGIDCMAMNVNDLICVGARPVAFVDYLAMDVPDPAITSEIGIGLKRGADLAGVDIVGGETATLPELVKGFDLAGSAVGVAKKERLVTGEKISEGDVIIGLPSSGPHSNGYTLLRKALEDRFEEELEGRKVYEHLLEPTTIYVKNILRLLADVDVHGLINITGGGFRNLTRLNKGFRYLVDDPLPVQPIFDLVKEAGNIEEKEMYGTFNMGMGFAAFVAAKDAHAALDALDMEGARVVGSIGKGKGIVIPDRNIHLPPYI